MSDELLREIQEDMQREKLYALWKRYGDWLIGISGAIVLGTALWVGLSAWQSHRHEAQIHALNDALKPGKPSATAVAELTALANANEGELRAIALLRAYQLLQKDGKTQEAQALLANFSKEEPDENAPFSALVKLISGSGIDQEKVPVSSDKPFSYTRTELSAWHAWQKNDRKAALDAFAALKEAQEAPSTLRERALQMWSRLATPQERAAAQSKPFAPAAQE